jgi:hypothetical protein
MRHPAARPCGFRALGPQYDFLFYFHAKQIGALNPAFSILDGNIS